VLILILPVICSIYPYEKAPKTIDILYAIAYKLKKEALSSISIGINLEKVERDKD
jgi:hypothetical protein